MYTDRYLKNVASTWDKRDLSYCDPQEKSRAHTKARKVLRSFAQEFLKLTPDSFEVRSNPGGIAVSGEVTLHTDPFGDNSMGIYVQIGQSWLGPGHSVMYRTCDGRRDYTGHMNRWGNVADLLGSEGAMRKFAATILHLCNPALA